MRMSIIALGAGALLLGAAVAAPPKRTAGFTLRSATLALPDDPIALDPDPDAQLVQTNCLACHSASMIALQPRLTEAQWVAEVAKMRAVYKAPVSDEDATRLPAILARSQAAR